MNNMFTGKKAKEHFCVAGVVVLLVLAGIYGFSKGKDFAAVSGAIGGLSKHSARLGDRIDSLARLRAGDRVITLPEDGTKWHTVLVVRDPKTVPEDRQLVAMFASNSRLQSLSAQTMYHEYSPAHPLYASRYAQEMGGKMPQVWLLRDDGAVCYKASGSNIPKTSEALADEISEAIGLCRPKPAPEPAPLPTPEPPPDASQIPDIRPVEPETKVAVPLVVGVLLVLAAGVAGLVQEWKASVKG